MQDNIFSPKVSLIPSCAEPDKTTDVNLLDVFTATKNCKWKYKVEPGRPLKKEDPKAYTNYKAYKVPAYTAHGTFNHANNNGLKEANGLACFDADKLEDKEEIKERLKCNPYVYSVFDSFGGDGLVIFVKIPVVTNADEFEQYHSSLRQYFFKEYGLVIDEGAKSLKNLRLVSFDPDLFLKEDSRIWMDLPEFKPKNKLLPKNNHRTQILSEAARQMNNGKGDAEILESLKEVHIDPVSCCSDPAEINKLITDLRSRYFADAEGKGVDIVQYSGFWTNNFKSLEIQLSTGLLGEFLAATGWRILDSEFVEVTGGVIYKRSKQDLYSHIIKLVSFQEVSFKAKDVTFTVDQTTLKTKAQKELKGNVNIISLPVFKFKILRDTVDKVYFHFTNCSLLITKDGRETFKRGENGVVWSEQVIQHELKEDDFGSAVYRDFFMNVSDDNYNAFRSATGMVLRNYNGSDGLRSLWLCDEVFNPGKNNGRLGKSIFWKAVAKLRKTDECSGKDFTPDYQFKFQNMSRDTQVYVIDDVKANFDFKAMYNYCTEGVEYQKKHQNRIKLNIHETPQLVITSNTPPEVESGASTTGRLLILPFKPYYSTYTDQGGVKAVHGHVFFDDWNEAEWNRFYWFMSDCAQYFLQEGIIQPDMSIIKANRLRSICAKKFKSDDIGAEFADWIYHYQLPKEFELSELKSEFDAAIDLETDIRHFASGLKSYFDMEGINFIKNREGRAGDRKTIWKI
jgi:hypothetical protein